MLIPLRTDVYVERTPWVNYAILGTTVLLSVLGLLDLNILRWWAGLAPMGVERTMWAPLAAITSSFVHVGVIHLAGNMLFLWLFGNAVNAKFGHVGYALLYLGAALASGLCFYGITGGVVVGASGAIYGVMGAYLIFYPRNDVTVAFVYWLWMAKTFSLSSFWMILYWVAWDVVSAAAQFSTGTAYMSHIGGFLLGFAVALTCLLGGWLSPTQDEQSLLQAMGIHKSQASFQPYRRPGVPPVRPGRQALQ
jgi:membrane associated rhomboid family serine protease